MRVRIPVLVGIFLLLWNVSSDPLSRIFEEDSPYITQINDLSIASGILPLSAAPPLSGYELQRQIDALRQTTHLSQGQKEKLSDLERTLFPQEEIYLRGSITLSPEFYMNVDENAEEWEWVDRYSERNPILSIEASTIFADHLFGMFTYGIEKRLNEEDFQGFSTSYPFEDDFSETNLQNSFPHTAYLSFASDHITSVAGRDTLSWGQGMTGNLLIGDHAPYHDFFLASTSNDILKYSFLTIPMNELDENQQAVIPASDGEYWKTLFHGSNVRMTVAHRLEAKFSPRFRVSITEMTLIYSDQMDLRMFSPLMIMHNFQNFGETNATAALEIESVLTEGLLLDFQFFLDQFQTSGELDVYEDPPPSAYAALLGLRYARETENGKITGFFEGAYTSPYVYLRAGDHTENYGDDPTNYNLDLLNSVTMREGKGSVSYLGYKYGPDSIVVALHGGYSRDQEFDLFGDIRFIAQGENAVLLADGNTDQELDFGEAAMEAISPSGDVTYRLITGIGGSYLLPDIPLTLYGDTYFVNTWDDNGSYSNDVQITFGARYTLDVFSSPENTR